MHPSYKHPKDVSFKLNVVIIVISIDEGKVLVNEPSSIPKYFIVFLLVSVYYSNVSECHTIGYQ